MEGGGERALEQRVDGDGDQHKKRKERYRAHQSVSPGVSLIV